MFDTVDPDLGACTAEDASMRGGESRGEGLKQERVGKGGLSGYYTFVSG